MALTTAVSPAALAKADAIRTDHAATMDRIRGRNELTGDAKRALMAKAHVRSAQAMTDLRESSTADAAAQRAKLSAKVWGIDDVAGTNGLDRATASIGYRDAQDRAAALRGQQEALALLGRAERSGDELLARAVAAHAYESGWGDVVGQYLSTRPTKAQALGQLQEMDNTGGTMGTARHLFAFALPKPPELGSIPDYQLAAMAASAPAV